MKISLANYIDNTEENRRVMDTYELRNCWFSKRVAFRRKDGRKMSDEEIRQMQAWCRREIFDKHRTNWLGEEPEYMDTTDVETIRKYWPWMPDDEIRRQIDAEQKLSRHLQEDFRPEGRLNQPVTYSDGSIETSLDFADF